MSGWLNSSITVRNLLRIRGSIIFIVNKKYTIKEAQ
jgi:hypothetical protein